MVDLKSQSQKIKSEIDIAIQKVLNHGLFINGPEVKEFAENLAKYIGVKHVIPCGNGTDALKASLVALELKDDDEVIVPAFTYIAPAEMVAFRKLTPVLVDVDDKTFNLSTEELEKAITAKTKAIIPVHLFGQCCDMEPIMNLAKKYNLFVIEDNAQALGTEYIFSDGTKKHTGTIGHVGCTSFFPSKNLGCFGDGGAMFTNDDELAKKLKMIVNHGQTEKYQHTIIGCNSRLDTIQAAILNIKLNYLNTYTSARKLVAKRYTDAFLDVAELRTPMEENYSTHVHNQYTLKIKNGKRDDLKVYLESKGIPSMIYYPLPLQKQSALKGLIRMASTLDVATQLCDEVLSLPIHTEMMVSEQDYIIEEVLKFFKR